MVDDAGHGHGNRQPDPEPELVTVNPKSGVPRKRKAREDGQPAQPRRLTRSHEACARCRRKKSKVTCLTPLATFLIVADPDDHYSAIQNTPVARLVSLLV